MEREHETRPFPLRFELPGNIKCLRVERVVAYDSGFDHWRLWLMANGDFSLGTFIKLLDNGMIERVTWHEDGTENVFVVNEKDNATRPKTR